jgi:hypothetical protein
MKRNEDEPSALQTQPALDLGEEEGERTSLVAVLTDFLQGAGKYVLEDDCESYCA